MTLAPLGWLGILRLGLVQTALGAVVVLTTSTLNRVMVIELALPATLPGALVALHYAVQAFRPRFGYGSDVSGRRTPWIVGGMGVLSAGGLLAAVATALMATSLWAGVVLAVSAFLLIGLGVGAAGTSLLALLAKRVEPRRRAAAATIVWLMMIAGFIVTAATSGSLLDPFSPERLVAVAAGVAGAAFLLTLLAVRGVEPPASAASIERGLRAPLLLAGRGRGLRGEGCGADGRARARPPLPEGEGWGEGTHAGASAPDLAAERFGLIRRGGTPHPIPLPPREGARAEPGFGAALRQVWAEPRSRRFAVFVFVSMLAYSAQDLILEPFAGAVFGLSLGESTRLSGVQNGGVFVGMLLVALAVSGGRLGSLPAWTVGGCLLSAAALGALAAAGLVGPAFPLRPAVFALGLANGAFAVAAIGSMMSLAGAGREGREGTRMGLWGAAQALAFGLGGFAGTLASDAAHAVLGSPAAAYGAVFAGEGALFLLAAVLALRVDAPIASAAPGALPLLKGEGRGEGAHVRASAPSLAAATARAGRRGGSPHPIPLPSGEGVPDAVAPRPAAPHPSRAREGSRPPEPVPGRGRLFPLGEPFAASFSRR